MDLLNQAWIEAGVGIEDLEVEDEPARLNVSRDLFEDSVEDPYHFSQLGAGLATQTALALSISEVKSMKM